MAEGTEESLSAPGFTHLEVLKEIFLMFQQQFSGGFQKFPSLCDPQGGAPSVPQHSWVCEVQLGPPENIWRWCVESQDLPKIHLQTLFFFTPLISSRCSWISGGPARVRMPSLKSLVFTVGRENSSKAGLGISSAVLLCWGMAAVGGCWCSPAVSL